MSTIPNPNNDWFGAMDSTTRSSLDIQENILVRLQVNDLIRCKSVCKSWNSLISSPRFVKSHLNNIVGDTRITALTSTSLCDDDCRLVRSRECQVVGSSNGLVCVSRYNNVHFLVVNPSTREVKEVTTPPQQYCFSSVRVAGFGYDSSIDDYKVVIGFKKELSKNKMFVFEVLTLKSNVWRSVAVESGYDKLSGNGIVCSGAIHWTTSRNKKKVIVSFDLSKEVFTEIPQPKLVRSDWKLGTMNNCLCIFARPNEKFRKNKDIEIWVMGSYNVQEAWERKLPPPGYDAHKMMMHYIPQKDFSKRNVINIWMLEDCSRDPVLLRSIKYPDNGHFDPNFNIRLSTNPECNYNYDEHVFVKSLVSPHGMGNEERVKRKRQNVKTSDKERAKSKRQSLLSSDSDGDEQRRVETKRRFRRNLVYYSSDSSDGERAKSKRQCLLSSDSEDDGKRARVALSVS